MLDTQSSGCQKENGKAEKGHAPRERPDIWVELEKNAECLRQEDFDALVVSEVTGSAPPPMTERLRRHLESCKECASMYDALCKAEAIIKKAISAAVAD